MKASQLKDTLIRAFKARRRVLIKGPPGIGKTDIVMQAAEEAGFKMQLSHPAISDPTDYKGMPAVIEGEGRTVAEFLPFGDLDKLIQATEPTVCFLDDIGQAPNAVQAALMQLILARRVNGHRISDHVVFCGATNDTNHMAGVGGMLEPVKSRFSTIVELAFDLEDWCVWALENDMPPELIGFARFRTGLINDFKPTRELKNSACPRTVAEVGNWLKAGEKSHEVIAGAAGEGFATEFVAYLQLVAELPNLDAIFLDPDSTPIPTKPGALYAVTTGLAQRMDKGNAERGFRYINRMPKEFQVCCVRDLIRLSNNRTAKDKTAFNVQTHAGFTTWAINNGKLLT